MISSDMQQRQYTINANEIPVSAPGGPSRKLSIERRDSFANMPFPTPIPQASPELPRKSWFDISEKTKERLVVAAKILLVAIIVAGLITATVFTAGAAGAVAAGVAAGFSSFVLKGALIGLAVGTAISSVGVTALAYHMRMHEYTGNDLAEAAVFAGASIAGSALVSAYCMSAGANDGAKLGLLAVLFFGAKLK